MSKQSRPYRLMSLLESLSKEEFYELGNYLNRRAGNKTNDKIRLYKYLRKYWFEVNGEEKPEITNELLQKRMFKKKSGDKNKINNLNSQLVTAIKGFLVEEALKADAITHKLLLSRTLKKRGLDEFFLKHNEGSIKAIQADQNTLEATQYDALYMLTYDVTFHRDIPKIKISHEDRLRQTEQHLDMAYILRKLQIKCEQITSKYIVKTNENTTALSIDLNHNMLKKNGNKLIQTYLYIIELYDKKTFDVYQKIKIIITNTQLKISNEIRMSFVRLMINYCHKRYSDGETIYLSEICALYYFAYENHLLVEDSYMSEIDYLNLTKVILVAEDAWNEKTLFGMANLLKPEYRENGQLLAEAIMRFKQKNYGKTQELLLQKIRWRNVEYKLDAHCLLIRTLYEIPDYKQLRLKLHSFASFIDKDKTLSEERKLSNRNFIHFVTKIAEYKAASTFVNKALAADLFRKPIVYSDWCDAKLKELTA